METKKKHQWTLAPVLLQPLLVNAGMRKYPLMFSLTAVFYSKGGPPDFVILDSNLDDIFTPISQHRTATVL
ncbi:hypothetical protein J6590_010709 [Homalodisca vitripennis]|nr:hypothetical protein J6590_010709 [Homalodisca vitripennis]